MAVTPLEEWISYLKTGLIPTSASAPGLPEAREKLRYYDMTPAERLNYDRHLDSIMIQNDVLSSAKTEGYDEGYDEGYEEGIEKARKEALEKTKQIAANLKKTGLSSEAIAQSFGLSMEEVERL